MKYLVLVASLLLLPALAHSTEKKRSSIFEDPWDFSRGTPQICTGGTMSMKSNKVCYNNVDQCRKDAYLINKLGNGKGMTARCSLELGKELSSDCSGRDYILQVYVKLTGCLK